MLRFLLTFTLSAMLTLSAYSQTNQETARELGQTAGEIAGDIANRSAEFLREKGPELIQKSQKGLNVLLSKAESTWQEVKLTTANIRDYNAYCDKDTGPFRDSALCISLRPNLPERAPIIIVLNALALTSGVDADDQPNTATVLSWRLQDAIDMEINAGNTVSAVVHQLYRKMSMCVGDNTNCYALEQQVKAHKFVAVLKDIILFTEATYGTTNNNTAKAAQTIKTAYDF